MRRCSLLLSLLIVVPASAQPKTADPTKLTLDRIFVSGDFNGEHGPAVKWLDGGAYTTSQPSKTHKGASDLIRVDAAGKTEVLVPAENLISPYTKKPLDIHDYEFTKDLDLVLIYTNSVKVWRQNTRGDYWTYKRSTNQLRRLGYAVPSALMFAKLSPDGTRVGYVWENNLYVEPVQGGTITKLTLDGTSEVINGTFDWVYEEEFDCRDGWRWSPDGKQIAYWQLDTRDVKKYTLIDNTSGTYPILKTFAYPKTGERNSACHVGVVPVTGGGTVWLNIPGDTRTDFYIPRMEWLDNSRELAIQRINRLQNALDVMVGDSSTGRVRTMITERDGSWIDMHDDSMEWVEKGDAFSWISERDGWRHLYFVSKDGGTVRRITSGEYDVIRVLHIDEKGGFVYFLASLQEPTRQYLYRVSLRRGSLERLTPADEPGWHDYQFSKEGDRAIHTHSSFGSPPRVKLISIPEHKVIRTLAANDKLRDAVRNLDRTPVEFFKAGFSVGISMDGWLMKPVNFDPAKKYPILFNVYGEPAGQEVVDRWGGNSYLWYLMLNQQGYAVACVDNRGTPCPRGRDWRRSVYRKIGTLASEDQAAAARDLLKRPYLDPTRVGVWGWSGGGTMTLNLMFRYPEIYRTGMSVAPVPDMHLYDTIYQERYMGLPQDNDADYKLGSPITHAAGLRGNLLIVHGSGDDNVHYQGTEKLVDKLVELNKPFTLMAYPNRTHSISEGKNTTRHLYGLLTRYLNENMPVEKR
jgi:dipeptidyl-peptidase-4